MTTLTRKARTWHATAKVTAADIADINDLPEIAADIVYDTPITALPVTHFTLGPPQRFIMRRAHGRRFVIDTAGYSYARYAAELVG